MVFYSGKVLRCEQAMMTRVESSRTELRLMGDVWIDGWMDGGGSRGEEKNDGESSGRQCRQRSLAPKGEPTAHQQDREGGASDEGHGAQNDGHDEARLAI
jgi:hypothetical protein